MIFRPLVLFALVFCTNIHLTADTIHEAAKEGELEKVKGLVTKDPEAVNDRDTDSSTPLHEAVRNGHKDVVIYLLANKADPDAVDKNGMTPKKLAKGYSRPEILALLEGKSDQPKAITTLALGTNSLEKIKEVTLLPDGRVLVYHGQGLTPLPFTNCPAAFLASWGLNPEEAQKLETSFATSREAEKLGLPIEDSRPKFVVKQDVISSWATGEPWNTKEMFRSEGGKNLTSRYYKFATYIRLPDIAIQCLFGPESGQLKQAALPSCGYSYPGSSGYSSDSKDEEKLEEQIRIVEQLVSLASTNSTDALRAKEWLSQVVKVVYKPRHRFLVRDLPGVSIYVVETMSYYVGTTEFKTVTQNISIYITPARAKVIVPKDLYWGQYEVFRSEGIRAFISRELAGRVEVD